MTPAAIWGSHLSSCNICHHAEPGVISALCLVGQRLCVELYHAIEVEAGGRGAVPDGEVTPVDVTERYKVPMFATSRGRR